MIALTIDFDAIRVVHAQLPNPSAPLGRQEL